MDPSSSTAYRLYGLPHSLYTGPARAYLRKQRIDYLERPPTDARYIEHVAPAIGRAIVPVLECPDGTLVQDSVDIIDHFESRGAALGAYPAGPRQRLLALLLQLYGSQGLLPHAMHFRWSYYDAQAAFLDHAFSSGAEPGRGATVMRRMQGYLPMLGVSDATRDALEASYDSLLARLDAHFATFPYLFGTQPSVGDYGLFGPLFAHLGRDPVPAARMKTRAPNVFRWVERMHAPDADMPEYAQHHVGWLPADGIPNTLEPLIEQVGADMNPQLADRLSFIAAHTAARSPADGDPVSAKPHQRSIGVVSSRYRGVAVEVGVQPYLLYLVERVAAQLRRLNDEQRDWAQRLLAPHGLWTPFAEPRAVTVARRAHIEVWSLRGS